MNNLYKKIYEAINIGIQRALILDQDISMNYKERPISNNSNLMLYYVNELLKNDDIEYNYNQIINYYKETNYTYEVKNFNELKEVFNKIKDIENVSYKWISNMKDYISIVLNDDTEINFYEKPKRKALFLKFANDDIVNTGNELLIYIHENHKIIEKEWQTEYKQIQDDKYLINEKYGGYMYLTATKDYSGYETCLRIHDTISDDPESCYSPAILYCLGCRINNKYQGYLPSLGQLVVLLNNIDIINYILKQLNSAEINLTKGKWWSSTEYSANSVWMINGAILLNIKTISSNILPLFIK